MIRKRPSHPSLALSEDLIELWAPLLRHLDINYANFAEEFVSALLSKLIVDEEPVMDKILLGPFPGFFDSVDDTEFNPAHASASYISTIAAWLKYAIETTSKETDNGTNSVLLQEISMDDILEYCLKNPNLYTRHLLKVMTDADTKLKHTIAPFMDYIDNVLSDRKKKTSTATHLNEEQMQEDLDLLSRQIDQSKGKTSYHNNEEDVEMADCNSNGWSLFQESEWNICPLGCLPDGSVPVLDLPIELDSVTAL